MIAPSHHAFEPALAFYRMATSMLGPFAPALLNWRRRRGKEDPLRMTPVPPAGLAVLAIPTYLRR